MRKNSSFKYRFALVLPFAVGLAAGQASAGEGHRELGAHEHGHGRFNVAIDGGTVQMELIAPGADIVGFEHAPKTDEHKAKLAAAKAALGKIESVVGLPKSAGCSLSKAAVEMPGADGETEKKGHGHDHGHDKNHAKDEHEEAHSEFRVTYDLKCSAPGALGKLTFSYFDSFKAAQELDVTVVTAKGQKAFEVTRAQPEIGLGGLM